MFYSLLDIAVDIQVSRIDDVVVVAYRYRSSRFHCPPVIVDEQDVVAVTPLKAVVAGFPSVRAAFRVDPSYCLPSEFLAAFKTFPHAQQKQVGGIVFTAC